MSDTLERYYAEMEYERNEAEEAYFKARPQADLLMNRQLFRAGFERGFRKNWDRRSAVSESDDGR